QGRIAPMMSQELFERPEKQYEKYSIVAFPKQSKIIGDPESFENAEPTPEQEAAMESILDAHPASALTFDDTTGLWMVGEEDNIVAMFRDRDALVVAWESDDASVRVPESD